MKKLKWKKLDGEEEEDPLQAFPAGIKDAVNLNSAGQSSKALFASSLEYFPAYESPFEQWHDEFYVGEETRGIRKLSKSY